MKMIYSLETDVDAPLISNAVYKGYTVGLSILCVSDLQATCSNIKGEHKKPD
jgi:hypothetical protein